MSKKWIWIICSISVLILLGAGFAYGKYYEQKQNDKKSNSNINANKNTNANANANTNASSNVNANTNGVSNANTNANTYVGWSTYTNSKNNYTIKYPAGGTTALEDTGVANDDICVKVSTEYIYAIIATGTQDDQTMCLRAGLGQDWTNIASQKITILGKEYTFTGMGSESASAGNHDAIYSGSLDSGEGLSLSVSVNEKNDAKGTKFVDKKAELIKMIQSFSHIK